MAVSVRVTGARAISAKPCSRRNVVQVRAASEKHWTQRVAEVGQKVVPVVAAACLLSLPTASPSQAGWWNQKSLATEGGALKGLDAAKGINQNIDSNVNDGKTTGNKILDAVRETEKAFVPQNTSQTGSKVQDIGLNTPSQLASNAEKAAKAEEIEKLGSQPFSQAKPGSNKTPATP